MCGALAELRDLTRTPLEGIFRDIVMVENGRATKPSDEYERSQI